MLETFWADFSSWLARPASNDLLLVLYIAFAVALILFFRSRRAEKKARRAVKFEELVAALFAHKHWLDTMSKIGVFDHEGQLTLSPFAKVQAISSVYFPEFAQEISELDLCRRPLRSMDPGCEAEAPARRAILLGWCQGSVQPVLREIALSAKETESLCPA